MPGTQYCSSRCLGPPSPHQTTQHLACTCSPVLSALAWSSPTPNTGKDICYWCEVHIWSVAHILSIMMVYSSYQTLQSKSFWPMGLKCLEILKSSQTSLLTHERSYLVQSYEERYGSKIVFLPILGHVNFYLWRLNLRFSEIFNAPLGSSLLANISS